VATGTRDRLLDSGAALFARQGLCATGLKQLVTEAKAPFGSLYHHFPGGKSELAAEVVRRSGAGYARMVSAYYEAEPDPVQATQDVFAAAADTLRTTGYAVACPIATIALETCSTDEVVRQACQEVFESWTRGLARRLLAAGVDEETARRASLTILSLLEGGFLFSQTARTTEALDVAGAAAVQVVAAAVEMSARPAG
jgi:AcrR family transcriptional regulator